MGGWDRLTSSRVLISVLSDTKPPPDQKLFAGAVMCNVPKLEISEAAFRWAMNEDPMATEKLAEGIRSFAADQVKLEQLLSQL